MPKSKKDDGRRGSSRHKKKTRFAVSLKILHITEVRRSTHCYGCGTTLLSTAQTQGGSIAALRFGGWLCHVGICRLPFGGNQVSTEVAVMSYCDLVDASMM